MLTGVVSIAVVLVAMFLLGVAEVFADTTTSTLLPMVVDKPDLGIGNARIMAGMITANQMVGPPIGAALFALGMAFPFVIQAVCVALGAVLVSRMVTEGAPRAAEPSHVRQDIGEGFRWTWGHAPVRTLTLAIVTFNVTWGAAWSVLVLYSIKVLGMGAVGFGLLTSVAAVGGLVGTASYGWLERRFSLAAIMRVGLTIETLTHLALALNTSFVVALVIMFVFGAHAFVWGTTLAHGPAARGAARVPGTGRQRLHGRVYGGLVVGSAVGGVIAGQWGITAPFWFAFVGSAVILALIWRQLDNIAHADEAILAESRGG